VTRRTYAYDPDLDCLVQIRGPGSNHPVEQPGAGMQIIRDIEPYRTAAADVAAKGKRPVIAGRRQHREFLRRNGYVEVGNERPVQGEREALSRSGRIEDIRRAMGDFG
jgi:hypothetical protein